MVVEWVSLIAVLLIAVVLARHAKRIGYADIREAPLHVNNALKDETKRKIIRALKTEKKYLTVIAREIGESVAKAKYHLSELERLGLVGAMQLSREKFFMLTEKGKWCLRAIDVYYPKSNLKKVLHKVKRPNLKWKETHSKL